MLLDPENALKDVAKDLDNDSVNDIWAWSGNTGSFTTDMIFANGGQLVGSGADGAARCGIRRQRAGTVFGQSPQIRG